MKIVRNYILNNLELDDKLSILHCWEEVEVSKVDQTQKFDNFFNLIVISNDTVHCFGRNKIC